MSHSTMSRFIQPLLASATWRNIIVVPLRRHRPLRLAERTVPFSIGTAAVPWQAPPDPPSAPSRIMEKRRTGKSGNGISPSRVHPFSRRWTPAIVPVDTGCLSLSSIAASHAGLCVTDSTSTPMRLAFGPVLVHRRKILSAFVTSCVETEPLGGNARNLPALSAVRTVGSARIAWPGRDLGSRCRPGPWPTRAGPTHVRRRGHPP
jgi:hypothetical protein